MNKTLPPPPTVAKEAQRIYREYLEHEDYPKDIWFAINTWWDINLHLDGDDRKATLYPVRNDETDTNFPYPVHLASG